MLHQRHDLIAAIATASGRGAVGIVRVSGADLAPVVQALFGQPLTARHAHYLPFPDQDGQALDHGLALFFPAPHSYTGEDVLELQAHGGPVVLQLLLARCLQVAQSLGRTARVADPGEFTLRAYLNQKLDLAQAEAVADLIDASTETAARSASRALDGVFSRELNALHDELVRLRVLVEATLDFPEEEIDFLEQADALGRMQRLARRLQQLQARTRQGALLREGLQVVLAGPPNVGKSALLNALAGAELAIVTPIAGTTRDKVATTLQIEGVPLHVVDTAGLREDPADAVERIGIDRSWQAIAQSEVVLVLHDLTRQTDPAYRQAHQHMLAGLQAQGVRPERCLQVFNKCDVAPADARPISTEGGVVLSAHTGEGLAQLRQALLDRAGWTSSGSDPFIARARHVQALQACTQHLLEAQDQAQWGAQTPWDCVAESLRRSHDALGTITGHLSADDLLGEIFQNFCIGK